MNSRTRPSFWNSSLKVTSAAHTLSQTVSFSCSTPITSTLSPSSSPGQPGFTQPLKVSFQRSVTSKINKIFINSTKYSKYQRTFPLFSSQTNVTSFSISPKPRSQIQIKLQTTPGNLNSWHRHSAKLSNTFLTSQTTGICCSCRPKVPRKSCKWSISSLNRSFSPRRDRRTRIQVNLPLSMLAFGLEVFYSNVEQHPLNGVTVAYQG